MSGDLAGAMRSFDTSSLRSPNDVASARFKAWATQRWNKLEEDVSDEAEPLTPPPLDTEQTVREALDKTKEGGGRALFDAMVATLPGLLEQLTQVDGKPVADHDSVPEAPGVYFFSEGVNPIYVGQSRHLRRRLRQHTSPSSRETKPPSRGRSLSRQAKEDGHPVSGTRKDLEGDEAFSEHFRDAKRRVARWTCDSSRSPIPSREPSSRSTPRELWAPMSSTPGRRTDRAGALLQRRSSRGSSKPRPIRRSTFRERAARQFPGWNGWPRPSPKMGAGLPASHQRVASSRPLRCRASMWTTYRGGRL